MAMELEDDLFFADLSKQISLLIMDDEDPVTAFPPVSFQAFSGGNYPSAPSHFIHEQNCRRESCKGTGVFIPKSSHPRRKHRQGRYGKSLMTGIVTREWFLKHQTTTYAFKSKND
uniref:Uncharacterized protein n=1 Tax=Salix viminalis TaxID=40686 RepID=A0A6N2KZ63_SALVM